MVGRTLLISRWEMGGCCANDVKAIALSINKIKRFFMTKNVYYNNFDAKLKKENQKKQ